VAANPIVPTPELQLNTEVKAEETIVHGSGRITSATSDLLQRTIRGLIPGTKRIVLDLAEVNYIDSSGLAALIEGMQNVQEYDGKFALTGLQEPVRTIFEIARLDQVFRIFSDVDAALAAA